MNLAVSVCLLRWVTVLEKQLRDEVASLHGEISHLRSRIDYLLRRLYAPSSEKIDPRQLQLELAQLTAQLDKSEPPAPAKQEKEPRARATRSGRRSLPENLEEQVVYLDPEEVKADPQSFREIGQERSEQLDIIPPKLLKIVSIRRKYVRIDDRQAAPVIAPMPPRPIDKGLPTARLLAWITVAKFCDHNPFYRQEKAFKRLGYALSRKTMGEWMRAVEFWLSGIYQRMRCQLLAGNYLQADETPVKFIDPDISRKGCGQGYLWVLSAPGGDVLFHWSVSRSHSVAETLLGDYTGLLQCDGYQAYQRAEKATRIACMAHIRRKFVEARNEDVPFAAFVILSISKLYQVEERLRDTNASPVLRQALRQSESRMVFERLGKALKKRQERHLAKTRMGEAITYALGQWEAMSRYLQYGEVEIDNNLIENAVRPAALGRKNWLFIGHPKAGSRSAVIYSIILSCQRHGIDPFDYLADVLETLPALKDADQDQLTPAKWAAERNVNRLD